MKIILEYADELDDAKAALNARSYALVIWELDQRLRAWLKYGHEFTTAGEALEAVRNSLRDFIDDHECWEVLE